MRVGVWAQQREIGFPISTDNASWRGPNIEAGGKSAYNASWRGNIEADGKSAYNASWGGTTIKKYFSIEISIFMHEFYSCIPILSTLAV